MEDQYVNAFLVGCYVGEIGCHRNRESKLYITVYVGDEEESINKQMTDAGFGCSVQQHEEGWHKVMRIAPKSPLRKAVSVEAVESKYAEVEKSVTKNVVDSTVKTRRSSITMEVTVNYAVDPGQFYVRHQQKEVILSRDSLDKVAPTQVPTANLSFGEIYAVFDAKSDQWYRGNCVRQCENGVPDTGEKCYDFLLIDEGFEVVVPASSVRRLTDDLKSFRPLVWECSLHLKRPKGGWSAAAVQRFETLVLSAAKDDHSQYYG
jgi:hypothetical protein